MVLSSLVTVGKDLHCSLVSIKDHCIHEVTAKVGITWWLASGEA